MAASFRCVVEYGSNVQHFQQLFAGIRRLERLNILRARWRYRDLPEGFFILRLSDGASIGFDTSDSARVCQAQYSECDAYFKRSLEQTTASCLRKLHPLGLNYLVYDDRVDLAHVRRIIRCSGSAADRLRSLGVALAIDSVLPFARLEQERLAVMSAPPRMSAASDSVRVLFSARLWDPKEVQSKAAKEDRENINAERIELVRRLRVEFGEAYVGGIVEDSFSVTAARDVLVPRNFHRKQSYLRTLRASDIAVATTGLHGSIGWKFGEYVAFSKAIVTEPLKYLVPGPFSKGVNYLAYESVDDCVEKVKSLAADRASRYAMSEANARYYFDYLIPERMLLRAILLGNEDYRRAAVEGSAGGAS